MWGMKAGERDLCDPLKTMTGDLWQLFCCRSGDETGRLYLGKRGEKGFAVGLHAFTGNSSFCHHIAPAVVRYVFTTEIMLVSWMRKWMCWKNC